MSTSVTGISFSDNISSTQTQQPGSTNGSNSGQVPGLAASSTGGTTSSQQTGGTTPSQQDDTQISPSAQAQSLYQQGESIKQIAEYLGCSTQEVDTYLGISNSTTTTTSSSGSTSSSGQYNSSQVNQLLGML